MTVIKHVLESPSSVLLTLCAEDEEHVPASPETMRLIPSDYVSCGSPAVGARLNCEEAERIRHGGRRYEALARALRILEAGDNSASLLFKKLLQRGVDRRDAGFAVNYAVSHGYLREDAQIERLVLQRAKEKLWGRARIFDDLASKGYRREDVHAVLLRLEKNGLLDFSAIRARLFEKSSPQNDLEWKKIAARHGFDSSDECD